MWQLWIAREAWDIFSTIASQQLLKAQDAGHELAAIRCLP